MANRAGKWLSVGALLLSGIGLLTSGLGIPSALAQNKGKAETLSGTVTDTMCGMKHIINNPQKCPVNCVKTMGAKYALVTGDRTYTLEGKEAEVERLSGARAQVTGTVQGSTIQVKSIAAAKRYAEAPDMD